MAAAVVGVFLGGVVVLIEVILSVLGVAMFIAPYAGGALISVVICEEVPGAKSLVPGHVILNYLLVLLVVEVFVAVLVHMPQLSTAVTVLMSSFFLCIMGYVILDQFKPDSIGYCFVGPLHRRGRTDHEAEHGGVGLQLRLQEPVIPNPRRRPVRTVRNATVISAAWRSMVQVL